MSGLVVNELTQKMGALALTNGTPAVANPVKSSESKASDLLYLQEEEIVDATGALLTEYKKGFACQLTEQAKTRIAQFLDAPRSIKLRELLFTHFADVGVAPTFVGDDVSRLLGPDQVLHGLAAIMKKPHDTPSISKSLRDELHQRLGNLPEKMTVRFALDEKLPDQKRRELAEQYQKKMITTFGANAASRCYHIEEGAHLSHFAMSLTNGSSALRLTVVFTTNPNSKYVATADGLNVLLAAKGADPKLLDNEIGNQWVVDTAFHLLRIVQEGKNLSKFLMRCLLDGQLVTGNELAILNEELSELFAFFTEQTKDPRCTPEHMLFVLYIIAVVSVRLDQQDIAKAFVGQAFEFVRGRFPHSMPKEGLLVEGLQLVVAGKLSVKELEALIIFFGAVCGMQKRFQVTFAIDGKEAFERSHDAFDRVKGETWFRHLLHASDPFRPTLNHACIEAIKARGCSTYMDFLGHVLVYRQQPTSALRELLLSQFSRIEAIHQGLLVQAMSDVVVPDAMPKNAPSTEIEWIEALLLMRSDELQRVGFDLLYKLEGHIEIKKKWIRALLQNPSGQVLRFILQLRESVSLEEMTEWMKGITRRSYLFYQLLSLNEAKWLPVCVNVDPQEVFRCYQQIKKTDGAKGARILQQIPPAVVVECLVPQVAERDVQWPEEMVHLLQSFFGKLSQSERESLVKRHLSFVIHPQVASCDFPFFAKALKYLVDNKMVPTAAQKTYLRVMCRELVRVVAEQQLPSLHRLIDFYREQCGELRDEEAVKSILNAYDKVENMTKEQAEWYSKNRALFLPRVLPLCQLSIWLKIAERVPSNIESTVASTITKLHTAAQNVAGFSDLAARVVNGQSKAACFKEVFQPFFAQKKPETPAVAVKKPPSNHVDLKRLQQEGNWQGLVTKLLLCKQDDEEAKKYVRPLVDGILKQKPIDPNRNIFSVLEHFQIVDFEPWKSLIVALSEQVEVASLTVGIAALARQRSEHLSIEHKALWYAVMANPNWLCHRDFLSLLNEKEFFLDVLQTVRPESWRLELGKFAYLLVRDLIATFSNSPERDQFFPVMHLWVSEIVNDEAKFDMGCKLLGIANPNGAYADFERVSTLLQSLAPLAPQQMVAVEYVAVAKEAKSKKIRNGIQELAKGFERFLVPIAGFLRSSIPRLTEERAIAEVLKVVKALTDASVDSIDTVLVVELEKFPCKRAHDALAEVIGRGLIRARKNMKPSKEQKEFDEKLVAYAQRLVDKAPIEALASMYEQYFCGDGVYPSELTVNELLQKGMVKIHGDLAFMGSFTKSVYAVLQAGFGRLLEEPLTHPEPLLARKALNVELALAAQATHGTQEFMRQNISRYKQLPFDLYLRHVEAYGANEQSARFLAHLHYLHLAPVYVSHEQCPDTLDPSKIKEDSHEIIFSIIDHERFYYTAERALHPPTAPSERADIIAYGRPTVVKSIPNFVPSERKFFEINCRLVLCALKRLDRPGLSSLVRSRLLDIIAAELRVLLELFPQASLVPYLQNFVEACTTEDPLFEPHKKITYGILRLAFYKKVITLQTNGLEAWIGKCGKKVEDLSKASDDALEGLEALLMVHQEYPHDFSIQVLINTQKLIRSWYDERFVENFEVLGRVINRLFALWKAHPEVINNNAVLHNMDALVVPNAVFFGLDRGEMGRKFALELASAHLEALFSIYQSSVVSGPAPESLLLKVVQGFFLPFINPHVQACKNAVTAYAFALKRQQRFGVYEGNFKLFQTQVKRLIPLLTRNSLLSGNDLEELVIQFMHTVSLRFAEEGTLPARIALVNEWVQALVSSTTLGTDIIKRALVQLLLCKIISEVPCELKDTLLSWLSLYDAFTDQDKILMKDGLLQQLSFIRKRFKDPKALADFNHKCPMFLQKP